MENFRLRVFRAVARHLNFRVAAEELLLTQPAVTQQIKALESELGLPLFQRTGGRVSLTAAGQVLLPFAERLKSLADEALAAVAATTGNVSGELAIAASQTIGQYLLPRLIAGFVSEYPHVQITVLGGNTQTVLESLRKHDVQVALIEGPAFGQDVRIEPFMEDRIVCVVPAGHEWADQDISIQDLNAVPILVRELGSGSRRIFEQGLEEAGFKLREMKIGLTFDSTEGLLSAVEAGLGVAFVSRWAVRNQLALGTLRTVNVRELPLKRMFSLALLAGPEPAGAAGHFRTFVLRPGTGIRPRSSSGK